MNDTQSWLDLIEHFMATPSITRNVTLGLLASFAGTQWIKRWGLPVLDLWKTMPEPLERLVLVLTAFLLGAATVRCLDGSWLMALLVGVGSPSVYTLAMRTLYHFFPWLEPKISAQSLKRIKKADGTIHEVPHDHPTDHESGDHTIMAPKDEP